MEPLRIAILTSRNAPGLDRLLADPNRGSVWDLSIVVGSETGFDGESLLTQAGIPLELRPIRATSSFRNLHERERYDEDLAELVTRLKIDYVFLCGYDYILTSPVVERLPGKVLAVHDADFTLRDKGRTYAGPRAVRDAIFAGETETRSSVYLVTGEVAAGPLFLLSGPFPIASMAHDARERGDADFLRSYAALHRTWMVQSAWGPMMVRSLELLAAGTTKVVGDVVWIDGAPGPCRMGEAPASCLEPESMVARGIPRSCPFIG